MQDMNNRQNNENLETTMWVYSCEARVTKAIYHIQGVSKILQQILKLHITKSIAYRCINFFIPVFHEGNKPLSKIADKSV